MRVKILKGFLIHCGDQFLEGREGSIIDVSDNEILESVGDFCEILDHFPIMGKYKVVKPFNGHAIDETIDLYADEASKYVLTKRVVPVDDSLWRPGRELPSSIKSFGGAK